MIRQEGTGLHVGARCSLVPSFTKVKFNIHRERLDIVQVDFIQFRLLFVFETLGGEFDLGLAFWREAGQDVCQCHSPFIHSAFPGSLNGLELPQTGNQFRLSTLFFLSRYQTQTSGGWMQEAPSCATGLMFWRIKLSGCRNKDQ